MANTLTQEKLEGVVIEVNKIIDANIEAGFLPAIYLGPNKPVLNWFDLRRLLVRYHNTLYDPRTEDNL